MYAPQLFQGISAEVGVPDAATVREKLADLVCYREGINAHLTAAITLAQKSPGGLLMPNQSILYAGRVHGCANLPAMMHIARELCGGQICVTPDHAMFAHPETAPGISESRSTTTWSSGSCSDVITRRRSTRGAAAIVVPSGRARGRTKPSL
mgnify:CR=1 FL=1